MISTNKFRMRVDVSDATCPAEWQTMSARKPFTEVHTTGRLAKSRTSLHVRPPLSTVSRAGTNNTHDCDPHEEVSLLAPMRCMIELVHSLEQVAQPHEFFMVQRCNVLAAVAYLGRHSAQCTRRLYSRAPHGPEDVRNIALLAHIGTSNPSNHELYSLFSS